MRWAEIEADKLQTILGSGRFADSGFCDLVGASIITATYPSPSYC